MLSTGIIIPFDGNHADIPSGFTRETSLDGKYPKGTASGTNPNTTGGSATHTHTSPSHTHSMGAHSHSVTTGYYSGSRQSGTGSGSAPRYNHYHTDSTAVNSSSVQSVADTYNAFSNDPPYYEVIFIKSSAYNNIPNNGMVLSASTTRSGLAFHTASANKFLKGASTGANAGGTGGSLTNAHTLTHTHTAAHTHSGATGGPNTVSTGQSDTSSELASPSHTHPVTLTTTTPTSGNASTLGNQSETVQPAYRTLNAFKNTSGSSQAVVVGDIGLWLGTLTTIPVGWKLADGTNGTPDMRGRYLKVPSSASASSTGGSNTHTHAAQGHTHTIPSHTHGGSIGAASGTVGETGSGSTDYWNAGHTHSLASVSSNSASLVSANTTANSSSNEPEYRTVAYIQFEFPPVMPNPILKMMVDSPENVSN